MIRIRSKIAGFRRAGVAHAAAWTEYPDDRFTEEQLDMICGEPMLQVELTPDAHREAPSSKGMDAPDSSGAGRGKK